MTCACFAVWIKREIRDFVVPSYDWDGKAQRLARGKLGPTSIGGALWNNRGDVPVIFLN